MPPTLLHTSQLASKTKSGKSACWIIYCFLVVRCKDTLKIGIKRANSLVLRQPAFLHRILSQSTLQIKRIHSSCPPLPSLPCRGRHRAGSERRTNNLHACQGRPLWKGLFQKFVNLCSGRRGISLHDVAVSVNVCFYQRYAILIKGFSAQSPPT